MNESPADLICRLMRTWVRTTEFSFAVLRKAIELNGVVQAIALIKFNAHRGADTYHSQW